MTGREVLEKWCKFYDEQFTGTSYSEYPERSGYQEGISLRFLRIAIGRLLKNDLIHSPVIDILAEGLPLAMEVIPPDKGRHWNIGQPPKPPELFDYKPDRTIHESQQE